MVFQRKGQRLNDIAEQSLAEGLITPPLGADTPAFGLRRRVFPLRTERDMNGGGLLLMEGQGAESGIDPESAWNQLLEKAAAGEVSVQEIMRQGHAALWANNNHRGYVDATRAMYVMMQDKRIQQRFLEEATGEINKILHGAPDIQERLVRNIKSKDGFRLFDKLGGVMFDAYADSPSLIPKGMTFDDALATHQRLVGYVEGLWNQGCDAYLAGRFPTAVFFAVLAIEETGKMGRLWFDLLAWDSPDSGPKANSVNRHHSKKHFLGLVPGAVINARLDRAS